MAFECITKSTWVIFYFISFFLNFFDYFFSLSIHIAVTKLQTTPGIAEKFVKDLKDAVSRIMKQEDRQLGQIVRFVFFCYQ